MGNFIAVMFVAALIVLNVGFMRIADKADAECKAIGAVAARTSEGYTCVPRAK